MFAYAVKSVCLGEIGAQCIFTKYTPQTNGSVVNNNGPFTVIITLGFEYDSTFGAGNLISSMRRTGRWEGLKLLLNTVG